MSGITVAPLQAVEIDLAYPLARQAVPGLSWADWRRHARAALGAAPRGRGGILAARRSGRAHPSGLVCWRREVELDGGAVLVASHFVALDILDPAPVLAALVAAVEREAAALGCRTVRARIGPRCGAVGQVLAAAGLRREGEELVKGVARAAIAGGVS